MSLSNDELIMIKALEKDPLMSLSDLSKETSLSWPTVKKRYEYLKENQLIRTPFATYRPETIGLTRLNVIAWLPNHSSLTLMEQACREHPYTVYRSRIVGSGFGIFIQFNVPPEGKVNMVNFLNLLVQEKIITDYLMFSSTGIRKEIYPNLQAYDSATGKWIFSWKQWISHFDEEDPAELPDPPKAIDMETIKPIHFDILRLLTKDASTKQSDIMKTFGLSKSTAFNYYSFVMKNFVSSVRLNYDREYFDLTDTYLALIQNLTTVQLKKLFAYFDKHQPPFRISLDLLNEQSALIWGNMPPIHATRFGYTLWKKFPQMKLYTMVTRDEGASNYWFYPPNYDFEKKQWKFSEEYMVTEPFNRIMEFKQTN